jgi:3-methyladenine DNA glycosylase AlkD
MLKILEEINNKPVIDNIYGFKNYHGTKLAVLRKIAKQIAKEKRYEYFNETHQSYEEVMVHAYAIGYLKEDITLVLTYMKDFIKQIDNWSVCDSLCQNLVLARKYPQEVFEFLLTLIKTENEWENRIVVVTFLSHYLNDNYIDKVIETIKLIKPTTYMSKMGYAWMLATMMAKFPGKTLDFMNNYVIDTWTYNKAIQKMLESFRVSKEHKMILKNMKIK